MITTTVHDEVCGHFSREYARRLVRIKFEAV